MKFTDVAPVDPGSRSQDEEFRVLLERAYAYTMRIRAAELHGRVVAIRSDAKRDTDKN